ncbi:MAG: hypothetical protein Q8L10_04930 [Candidatus Moranbacteria bacterium]|nr:hypothetical protein [Candidatus Moranbacteria bacterium]
MVISIVSLIVGSLITWIVSHWYYNRSKDDFSVLVSKIDKIAQEQSKANNVQTDPKNLKFINVFEDTDIIGEAILSYARNSGAEMGSAERGIPIFALTDLINRIEKIKDSLQKYRDWRIHLGA